MQIVVVAVGGAVGAVLRYLVSLWVMNLAGSNWPYGTLVVNLAGCFCIGFLWQLFAGTDRTAHLHLLIFTGVLGAFTTFSTFGLESLLLLQDGRSRDGLLYLLASNLGGLLCVALGFVLSRYFLPHSR